LSVVVILLLCLIVDMTDAALTEENARLKVRLAETEAALADAVEAQRRLESIVSELRRERFGPQSEKLDPEQFNLPLEDVEIAQGVLAAAQEKARRALKGQGSASVTPNRNRGHLPKHLPRVERIIEPETTLCPCGCGEMARIGEDVSERLDVVPAQLRVLVTRRPKYACRRCSGAVVQAHAPEHVVPGGLPTEALIAQSWWPNSEIIFLSTAKPRSTPGRGLRWTGPLSATGSVALASTSNRSSTISGNA
jgi:hypothetical protein